VLVVDAVAATADRVDAHDAALQQLARPGALLMACKVCSCVVEQGTCGMNMNSQELVSELSMICKHK
jgi:hypothetical protein